MKRLAFLVVVLAIGGLLGCSVGMDIPAPTSPPTTSPSVKPPATVPTLTQSPLLETYSEALRGARHGEGVRQRLVAVKTWEGTESKEIKYRPPKSPWVVNAGFTPTSKIASKFDIKVWKEVTPDIRVSAVDYDGPFGKFGIIYSIVVQDGAEHIIVIEASGGKWWVKVGVEQ